MTKDEMQRYLNQQAQDGKSEIEAVHGLFEIIGINYPTTFVNDTTKQKGDA